MNNPDITKQQYAPWLEKTLRELAAMSQEQIVIAATGREGEISTSYYNCDPGDIAMIYGVLQQDALMMRLENNPQWLKSVIDNADAPEEEGTEE